MRAARRSRKKRTPQQLRELTSKLLRRAARRNRPGNKKAKRRRTTNQTQPYRQVPYCYSEPVADITGRRAVGNLWAPNGTSPGAWNHDNIAALEHDCFERKLLSSPHLFRRYCTQLAKKHSRETRQLDSRTRYLLAHLPSLYRHAAVHYYIDANVNWAAAHLVAFTLGLYCGTYQSYHSRMTGRSDKNQLALRPTLTMLENTSEEELRPLLRCRSDKEREHLRKKMVREWLRRHPEADVEDRPNKRRN